MYRFSVQKLQKLVNLDIANDIYFCCSFCFLKVFRVDMKSSDVIRDKIECVKFSKRIICIFYSDTLCFFDWDLHVTSSN